MDELTRFLLSFNNGERVTFEMVQSEARPSRIKATVRSPGKETDVWFSCREMSLANGFDTNGLEAALRAVRS